VRYISLPSRSHWFLLLLFLSHFLKNKFTGRPTLCLKLAA
jgi:hypothetical protein